VRVGLGLRLTLDSVHGCINVHRLGLTVVEVDGGKLYLIDAGEGRGVHLERVQREPKSRSGTCSTESKTRAVVHRDRRLVTASAEDEITSVVRMVCDTMEGTAWHHLGVAERAKPVMFRASL
jgi:hypothetical protein